jgi:hypothetical protein
VRRHDHPGRTKSALKTVFLPEPFLQWMQLSVLGQTFDSLKLLLVYLDCEQGARFDRFSAKKNRARAAASGVATDVRSG